MTLNYFGTTSGTNASFVQTIIHNFYIIRVYDPLYSAVHPMKYLEGDVMWYNPLYNTTMSRRCTVYTAIFSGTGPPVTQIFPQR